VISLPHDCGLAPTQLADLVQPWLPSARLRDGRRRRLRLLSIVAAAIVATLAVSGVERHDGLSFNARYFLELLPLAAVGFAWALDGRIPALVAPPLSIGATIGAVLAGAILFGRPLAGGPDVPMWIVRQIAILKLPLLMAAGLIVVWLLGSAGRGRPALLVGVVGACLDWGLALHVNTDVTMSQALRAKKSNGHARGRGGRAGPVGNRGTLGTCRCCGAPAFTRDIVVLDVAADDGQDAPRFIHELLRQSRSVFLLEAGVTPEVLQRVAQDVHAEPMKSTGSAIVQLRARSD
jgi:hypothetical protein